MSEVESKGSAKLGKLVDEVLGLSVLEASQLASMLAEKTGVDLNAVAASPAPAAAAPAEGGQEKDSFNVILENFGEKKIEVIKVVGSVMGTGLREAKAFVEGVPAPVKEGVNKEEAEDLKKKLETAGAKVKLD